MGKMKKALVILYGDGQYVVYDVTDKPVLIDEEYLRKEYPGVKCYTDAHKRKALEKTLCKMKVRRIDIPTFLPNAKRKIRPPQEKKRKPTQTDLSKGVRGLLGIAEIWENPFPGFWLISSMLTAMCCARLRRAGPDTLLYATEIRNASRELIGLISSLIRAVVTKERWIKEEWEKSAAHLY